MRSKAALRKAQLSLLDALRPERRAEAAKRIAQRAHPHLEGVARVALFASLPREIDTGPLDDLLRARGVERALPRTGADHQLHFHLVPPDQAARDLPLGAFQVPTPPADLPEVSLASCDLVFVPGLAFDDEGRRLGYGRGFYDRALAPLDGVPILALCFEELRVPRVPTTEADVRVHGLLTG